MTSEVVTQAKAWADQLRTAGARATHDLAGVELPCILVEPTPERDYDLLCAGYTATWTVACIAPGSGGLEDVEAIEGLLEQALTVFSFPELEVRPANYVLPGASAPKPAYLIRFQTTNTEETP